MIKDFLELIEAAKKRGPKRIAVAAAADPEVLSAVKKSLAQQLATPLLVGPKEKIRAIASGLSFDLDDIPIFDANTVDAAAGKAAQLAASAQVDLIMKGMLSTADMVKAVLDRKSGLRTDRMLSHVMLYEIPGFQRLVLVTDAAVNISPNLNQKTDIIKNACRVAKALGITQPKVAVLAALEKVNPNMPSTLDAQELKRMGSRGDFGDCIVDGPLALDDALNPATAHKKGISSPVSGMADILLAHDLESANLLGKSMAYVGHAAYAGVIMGAKVPLVIVGRGSTSSSRLRAIALGVVVSSSSNNNE